MVTSVCSDMAPAEIRIAAIVTGAIGPGNGSADEAAYLGPLEETLALGYTPAEGLLKQYETRWGRSVEPLFEEQLY